MPNLPPKRCTHPGCPATAIPPDYRCDAHKTQTRGRADRSSYHKSNDYFYSSTRWRRFRLWFLQRNPVCVGYECKCNALAAVVDHIKPIADGGAKLDASNCQPLCVSCHSRKTGDDVKLRKTSN